MDVLDFDKFLTEKDGPKKSVFILVLKGNFDYLLDGTHWLKSLRVPVKVVSLTEDEFNMLGVGKYPKVLVYQAGKELNQFNGIPEMETFMPL